MPLTSGSIAIGPYRPGMAKRTISLRLPPELMDAIRRSRANTYALGDMLSGLIRGVDLTRVEVPGVSVIAPITTTVTLQVSVINHVDRVAHERSMSRNALITAAIWEVLFPQDGDVSMALMRRYLGQELSSMREEARYTIEGIAAAVELSYDAVVNIENGEEYPNQKVVWQWCRACHRVPHLLYRDIELMAGLKDWE